MTITTRLTRSKACIAAAVLLAAGAAAVAQAANPESGTVSPENPKVTWDGLLTSSGVHQILWEEDPTIPCPAPVCDTFALTVDGGKQDLTIGLNIQELSATDTEPTGGIRVTRPDGTIDYLTGTSGPETTLRHRIRGADPGAYEITVNASYICCGETSYIAFAEVPAPAAPAAEPSPPAPSTQPAAPELEITAPRTSARKFRKSRRLRVRLESSGPISNLRGLLAKGRKRIARGSLDELDGRGRITLKASKKAARRLKKGTYNLSVSGTDSQGRTVGSAIRLKVRR